MSDTKWGLPHTPTDWSTPYGYTWNRCLEGHAWVDTGSRTTWCKRCDCDGELDPMTGTVTVVFKDKSDKQQYKQREE